MSKQIQLTQGKFATVDDEDFDLLNQWKWYAMKKRNTFYAARDVRHGILGREHIYMHSVLMNTPEGLEVDHIDRNGLNNQRDNLRICTGKQNRLNTGIRKNNTSGIKGVQWNKHNRKWKAVIQINGKAIHLGYFNNQTDASNAYNEAAIKYHGDFAGVNLP